MQFEHHEGVWHATSDAVTSTTPSIRRNIFAVIIASFSQEQAATTPERVIALRQVH
ncbi:MAG: hypothetical protein ACKOIZ_06695 [Actinomycetota bacterium]